jgi:hypothetical protein
MNKIHRLFLLFLVFFPGIGFAALPPPVSGWSSITGSDPMAGCYALTGNYFFDYYNTYYCEAGPKGPRVQIFQQQVCTAAGSTLSGSSCVCKIGLVLDPTQNSCIAAVLPDPCTALNGTSSGRMTAPHSGGSMNTTMTNLCEPVPASSGLTKFPGCSITVEYDFAAGGEKSGSGTYGQGCTPGLGDGSTPATPKTVSTEAAPIPGAPAPTPCKQGYASGTFNGDPVCIAPVPGSNTVSVDKKKVTSTDASGNTLNGIQEKTTTCTGGSCTTSTTVNNVTTTSSGSSTTSTTSSGTTESQDSFCRDNPSARECDGLASDSPLAKLPKLYTSKYPEGLAGVWNTKKAELNSTPLITLVDRLMPSIGSGGTCPVWSIDLSFGFADYGLQNVAPPCWIWSVAKSIVIVSALLLARALVFGG